MRGREKIHFRVIKFKLEALHLYTQRFAHFKARLLKKSKRMERELKRDSNHACQ